MTPPSTKAFYRPGLDALRLMAFLFVFFHHGFERAVEGHLRLSQLVQSWGFGLCLFFTLSAYLITTLLLREREATGTITLSLFYKRRILRIWPLYFLGLAIGLGLDWHTHLFPDNRSFYFTALVLAGNLVPVQPSFALHLWSLSVEEQFYLFWPGILRRVQRTQLLAAGMLIVALSMAITFWLGHHHADNAMHVWSNTGVQMQMFGGGILLAIWHNRRNCFINDR